MRSERPKRASVAGFTLIELMIVIFISAILLAVALPSFTDALDRNRIVTQNNELLAAFSYARSEGLRRNNRVGVCALNAALDGCATDNWNRGWAIWVDTNRNDSFTAAADEVLKVYELDVADSLTANVFDVQFSPRGTLAVPTGANAVFTLQPDTCTAARQNVRTITIRLAGSNDRAACLWPCGTSGIKERVRRASVA